MAAFRPVPSVTGLVPQLIFAACRVRVAEASEPDSSIITSDCLGQSGQMIAYENLQWSIIHYGRSTGVGPDYYTMSRPDQSKF